MPRNAHVHLRTSRGTVNPPRPGPPCCLGSDSRRSSRLANGCAHGMRLVVACSCHKTRQQRNSSALRGPGACYRQRNRPMRFGASCVSGAGPYPRAQPTRHPPLVALQTRRKSTRAEASCSKDLSVASGLVLPDEQARARAAAEQEKPGECFARQHCSHPSNKWGCVFGGMCVRRTRIPTLPRCSHDDCLKREHDVFVCVRSSVVHHSAVHSAAVLCCCCSKLAASCRRCARNVCLRFVPLTMADRIEFVFPSRPKGLLVYVGRTSQRRQAEWRWRRQYTCVR